ncbi:arylamine N-acetyltransferase [Kineosporia rhizophila]|uniref:arylamine N-acetyltransferase n=1 Tax=Kineosporia rhizophila TaxID=84633 RepID=UPI001E5F7521|nr:arylamine N-acetyltransferase [Kineosporia rhizophila]MCE0538878.1 arylamine N-acetyltransferase [Kineosporia rhizophila]
MGPRPTLKSVAAAAGVSTAQVSYAFNRPDRLSAQARVRILEVARQLGYSGPNAAARSLRTGKAEAIGVLFTVGLSQAFKDPYLLAMLGGLAEITEQTGTGLVLIPLAAAGSGPDELRKSLDAVQRAVIDAAVVADNLTDEHPAVQVLRDRHIPMVRESINESGPFVAIDDRAAARELGSHLAGFGHQNVVFVVYSLHQQWTSVSLDDESHLTRYSRLRLAGLREGLGPRARVRVVSGGKNSPSPDAAGFFDQPDMPTAIAADSDVMATGVLKVLQQRGLRPGRDISVTGFDDIPSAATLGLTTIRQPIHEKGRLMGRLLLDPTYTEEQVVLPTHLVARSSTGPAPLVRNHRPEGTAPVTTEWQSENLDLEAYLKRIGHTGPLESDEKTLAALHRAHVASIPFENLDVILGRGIAVDLEHVQAKLVDRQRGGYCYEHGMLFGAVAERLGFQVTRILARVGDPAEIVRSRSHLVLRVATQEQQWLADVGFGSGLLTPLPFTSGAAQQQGVWQYELQQTPDNVWHLREFGKTIQTFAEELQYFVDVEAANFNTSTNPNSPFTHRPIVVRKDETSVRALRGRTYSIERPGQPTEQRELSDSEFTGLLRSDFAPTLTDAEISALVASLSPQKEAGHE